MKPCFMFTYCIRFGTRGSTSVTQRTCAADSVNINKGRHEQPATVARET
jgi:hypothetical protein